MKKDCEHEELLARFVCAIENLALKGPSGDLATKHDLLRLEKIIMSAISDFASAVNTKFDEMGAAVDGITTSLTGVTADVAFLKDLIEQLQNSAGQITPEDQALLDQIQARTASLGTNIATVNTSLAALDAQTQEPPTP